MKRKQKIGLLVANLSIYLTTKIPAKNRTNDSMMPPLKTTVFLIFYSTYNVMSRWKNKTTEPSAKKGVNKSRPMGAKINKRSKADAS